jgi:hypothetical protein
LGGSWPAALCFQLERKRFAVVQKDQVSDARLHTQAGEDCCLNGAAAASVGDVKPNETGYTSLPKMLADSSLNGLFGRGATAREFSTPCPPLRA